MRRPITNAITVTYERFLLDFRALPFCFLPGGPPGLPDGVLASPGFLALPMVAAYGGWATVESEGGPDWPPTGVSVWSGFGTSMAQSTWV